MEGNNCPLYIACEASIPLRSLWTFLTEEFLRKDNGIRVGLYDSGEVRCILGDKNSTN